MFKLNRSPLFEEKEKTKTVILLYYPDSHPEITDIGIVLFCLGYWYIDNCLGYLDQMPARELAVSLIPSSEIYRACCPNNKGNSFSYLFFAIVLCKTLYVLFSYT